MTPVEIRALKSGDKISYTDPSYNHMIRTGVLIHDPTVAESVGWIPIEGGRSVHYIDILKKIMP